jgi:hypothetical protein
MRDSLSQWISLDVQGAAAGRFGAARMGHLVLEAEQVGLPGCLAANCRVCGAARCGVRARTGAAGSAVIEPDLVAVVARLARLEVQTMRRRVGEAAR